MGRITENRTMAQCCGKLKTFRTFKDLAKIGMVAL